MHSLFLQSDSKDGLPEIQRSGGSWEATALIGRLLALFAQVLMGEPTSESRASRSKGNRVFGVEVRLVTETMGTFAARPR